MEELFAKCKDLLVGQEHVLGFWDELDDAQRTALAGQVESIDFDAVAIGYITSKDAYL